LLTASFSSMAHCAPPPPQPDATLVPLQTQSEVVAEDQSSEALLAQKQANAAESVKDLHAKLWRPSHLGSPQPALNVYDFNVTCAALRDACARATALFSCETQSDRMSAQILAEQCTRDHALCLQFDVLEFNGDAPDYDLCKNSVEGDAMIGQSAESVDAILEVEPLQAESRVAADTDYTAFYKIDGMQVIDNALWFLPTDRSITDIKAASQEPRLHSLLYLLQQSLAHSDQSVEDFFVNEIDEFVNERDSLVSREDKALIIQALIPVFARIYLQMSDYTAFKRILAFQGSLRSVPARLELQCLSCLKVDTSRDHSAAHCSKINIPLLTLLSSTPVLLDTGSTAVLNLEQDQELECITVLSHYHVQDLAAVDLELDRAVQSALQKDSDETVQASMHWLEALLAYKKSLLATSEFKLTDEQVCKINELINVYLAHQMPIAASVVEHFIVEHFDGANYLSRHNVSKKCHNDIFFTEAEYFIEWYTKETSKKRVKNIQRSFSNLLRRYPRNQRWKPRLYLSFIAHTQNDLKHALMFSASLGERLSLHRNPQFYGWMASLKLRQSSDFTENWLALIRAFDDRDHSSAMLFAAQIRPYLDAPTRRYFAQNLLTSSPSYSPLASAFFGYSYLRELAVLMPANLYADSLLWIKGQISSFIDMEAELFLHRLTLLALSKAKDYSSMFSELRLLLFGQTAIKMSNVAMAQWKCAFYALVILQAESLPLEWLQDYYSQVLAQARANEVDDKLVDDFGQISTDPAKAATFLEKHFSL